MVLVSGRGNTLCQLFGRGNTEGQAIFDAYCIIVCMVMVCAPSTFNVWKFLSGRCDDFRKLAWRWCHRIIKPALVQADAVCARFVTTIEEWSVRRVPSTTSSQIPDWPTFIRDTEPPLRTLEALSTPLSTLHPPKATCRLQCCPFMRLLL